MAREHYFAVRGATEQTVRSEVLIVVGIDRFPAELLFEVLGCGLLNEGVFGVGGWVHSGRGKACLPVAVGWQTGLARRCDMKL